MRHYGVYLVLVACVKIIEKKNP